MEGLHHDTMVDDQEEPNASIENADSNGSQKDREEDFTQSPINAQLSKEDKVALYDQMVRIRRFEERSLRAYQQGHIGGFLHLYIGQEAVAVGAVLVGLVQI